MEIVCECQKAQSSGSIGVATLEVHTAIEDCVTEASRRTSFYCTTSSPRGTKSRKVRLAED